MTSCDLLIVAAFEPELAAVRARVAHIAPRVAIAAVGVGLVDAAIGTLEALDRFRPKAVALIGTCGAYRKSGLSIGDTAFARSILLFDAGAALSMAALPLPMANRIVLENPLVEALYRAGTKGTTVATTLGITTDDRLADELERASGADVEHLEAFAVAQVCARRNTPFVAVFGIANIVGGEGRNQWEKHHEAASAAAANTLCSAGMDSLGRSRNL